MSLETLFDKVKRLFNDNTRKRRVEHSIEGPPAKYSKTSNDRRIIEIPERDASRHSKVVKKPMMGSILSKFTSKNSCQPIEYEEFSDGEDVVFVTKIKKNSLPSPPIQVNNIQHYKMDGICNNRSSPMTRPVPNLISRNKFSRVPDLQKCYRPFNSITTTRPTESINGWCDTDSTIRGGLVNGKCQQPLKLPNSSYTGNSLGFSKTVSNYINSTNSYGPASTTSQMFATRQNDISGKLQYERLLKSLLPDYGNVDKCKTSLWSSPSTSKPSQNNVPNVRPPIHKSSLIPLKYDDINQKTEDTIRLLNESSIDKDHKVTPVNSMRMKHEFSFVFNSKFPDNVIEKYSSAHRQRLREISQQQEKSKAIVNTLLEEKRLYENRLPKWSTPDVIIFEEDIEEKVDDFPEFSDSQKTTVRQAMNGHPQAILNTKFNITITRDHIHTLQWDPLAWLNDEVINFYMNLLTERSELRRSDGYPKVYAMNTFFTQRLCSGGYSAVRRWTKKVDIFACDIIPVPVHVGNVHWCMAIINMKQKTIKYYDSMGSPNNRVLSALEQYLKEESLDKRKIEFDFSGWNTENVTDSPRQQNGSDCGVFSCMTAEFVCRNRPIVFGQQHMNYFRQKMVLEICTGKMLL